MILRNTSQRLANARVDGVDRIHRIIAHHHVHRGRGRILALLIIESDDGGLRYCSLDAGAFEAWCYRLLATCLGKAISDVG